ncbi:magnesium transporter MgtE [Thalassobacillus devorans]|uniref:Magnesium transporter MgtE n=2 Tax=Thalassobacillus devorans TaxID=279813 RepID=A0ABQ1PRX8_9BACI|nr:magnesium transporter [Thalassobacillus devorans]GGD01683.1 magnesium transporter MgtE [Thalassobacillus devorans]
MTAKIEYDSELMLEILDLVKENNQPQLMETLDDIQPYDLRQIYLQLPEKLKTKFLSLVDEVQLVKLIQELEQPDQLKMLNQLSTSKSVAVLNKMDNDDLAYMLDQFPKERVEYYLSRMQDQESMHVQNIMHYPPETAGRLMTNRFVWISKSASVRDTVDKLKTFATIAETINYLYVIDEDKKLVGVVSYRDLILADMNETMEDLISHRVISVPTEMDQEEVAQVIERYDFLAVPVVDDENHLKGIITVDDVIDVVIQEANEDIEKLSASGKDITFETNSLTASYRRLPWLILLLFIGLVSGSIISTFEETLDAVVALAFFMPLIAGMTGNTGTQSLAIVVRGLVSHDLDKKTVARLLLREMLVGIIMGLICGALILVVAYIWQGNIALGAVVGLSLVLTIIIGTLTGTSIPLLLHKFNVDPAVASGPLITTINDILSLFIYFSLARLLIEFMM